jgi:hypothetical protein
VRIYLESQLHKTKIQIKIFNSGHRILTGTEPQIPIGSEQPTDLRDSVLQHLPTGSPGALFQPGPRQPLRFDTNSR